MILVLEYRECGSRIRRHFAGGCSGGEHINENGQENHSGMTVTATIWGKTGKSYESFHPILSPGAIAIAGRVTGTAAALLRQVDITYTLYLKKAREMSFPLDFVHRF